MTDAVTYIAQELSLAPAQVAAVLQLFHEGGTIPFVARYRKETTGGLNEIQLRALMDRHLYLRDLDARKQAVLRSIEEQGKLTDEIRSQVTACTRRFELEDLFLPFRAKKRTRAALAREKGLEPLADYIRSRNSPDIQEADLEQAAAPYVSAEKQVATFQEALAGASDILAEQVAERAEHRSHLRSYILQEGVFVSNVRERFPAGSTKFEMYRDYKVPVKSIQPHNLLALRRGERSGILQVTIAVNEEYVQNYLESKELFASCEPLRAFYRTMLKDAYERLMRDSLIAEVRTTRKEAADQLSVRTFEANLRDVLLAPPAGMKPALGVNPGFRPGCRLAVVDAAGTLVEHATIFPHDTPEKRTEALASVRDLLQKHAIELIAIGNGNASRETDQFIAEAVSTLDRKLVKVIVNESGASVYASSRAGKEEFADLDVAVRCAVSLARRLQDPLAELVKIDPKSIGVGQYQHDVDQKLLRRKLDETVESCVNYVGVNLNTASRDLLRRVAGLNAAMASGIVAHRNQHGPFRTREELHALQQMSPKAFEQAAGFLRIQGGTEPLDATALHPEHYPLARRILEDLKVPFEELARKPFLFKQIDLRAYVTEGIGEMTLKDILEELRHPGRDPRRQFRYATFKEGVKEIKDLAAGMELEGVVTNVTNFGAFVDIGVHHDGLVHVSQLADRYVADPKSVVKVGQIVKVKVLEVNEQQKRISLTMKGMAPKPPKPRKKPPQKKREPPPTERHDERTYTLEDLKSKFNAR